MSYLYTTKNKVKIYTGTSRDFPLEGWIYPCSYCETPTSNFVSVEKTRKKYKMTKKYDKKYKFMVYFCKQCKKTKWEKWEKKIIEKLDCSHRVLHI